LIICLGTADQDEHCKKFMEILIPDAFRKVEEKFFLLEILFNNFF
jgi:hypothetical protein